MVQKNGGAVSSAVFSSCVSCLGVPLESAVRAASENPAKSIGVDNDYGSIAAAIFSSGGTRADQKGKAGAKEAPKVYEDIIMTLVEPTSKTVLGMGHTIDIKLRAGSNLKWNFDKEYKSLEFISERTEDGFVHAVFKAKEPGRETVYFDCLDVGDPLNVKVLETKLISVKVE